MPRRKVSLLGVNFDSVVTTLTCFAPLGSAAKTEPGTANAANSTARAKPAGSGRRPRVEWWRSIEKMSWRSSDRQDQRPIERRKQAYDRRMRVNVIALR